MIGFSCNQGFIVGIQTALVDLHDEYRTVFGYRKHMLCCPLLCNSIAYITWSLVYVDHIVGQFMHCTVWRQAGSTLRSFAVVTVPVKYSSFPLS
jgi:hypothetical protein